MVHHKLNQLKWDFLAISETVNRKDLISSNHSNKWAGKELAVVLDKVRLNKMRLVEDHQAFLEFNSHKIFLGFNSSLVIFPI